MSAAQKERQRRKQKILKWKEQDRLQNLQNAVQNASAGTLVQTLLRILSQQQSSIKLPAGASREAGPGIGEEGSGCPSLVPGMEEQSLLGEMETLPGWVCTNKT